MSGVKRNSLKAWWLAARPKTLTGALIPVMLGTALAFHEGQPHWLTAFLCGLFACGMQIAANFINDWYDFKKGTDREDRLGPERACAQGWVSLKAMKIGITVTLVISCLIGLTDLFLEVNELKYQGWEIIAIGALCVVFCFLYTTYLSYLGWGDLLVLVFFGIIPVCGTYYLQVHDLSLAVLLVSVISGVVIDTLLMVNNYRDREQDTISGKMTLVVRFGEPFGRYAYLLLGVVSALLTIFLLIDGTVSIYGFIVSAGVYLTLHYHTWKKMCEIRCGKKLNSILGENSRNMLLFGILLSLAIVC